MSFCRLLKFGGNVTNLDPKDSSSLSNRLLFQEIEPPACPPVQRAAPHSSRLVYRATTASSCKPVPYFKAWNNRNLITFYVFERYRQNNLCACVCATFKELQTRRKRPAGTRSRKELKMCVRLPGLQDYGGSEDEEGGVCDGGEIWREFPMQPRGNYDCYFMVSGRPLVYTLGALSWVGFWASWNPGNYRLVIGGEDEGHWADL